MIFFREWAGLVMRGGEGMGFCWSRSAGLSWRGGCRARQGVEFRCCFACAEGVGIGSAFGQPSGSFRAAFGQVTGSLRAGYGQPSCIVRCCPCFSGVKTGGFCGGFFCGNVLVISRKICNFAAILMIRCQQKRNTDARH